MNQYHIPVMVNEVLNSLDIKSDGIYVDLTFGGGGHSKKILEKLTSGHLYAFDQDEDSISEAQKIINKNFTFIQANSKDFVKFLLNNQIIEVDGIFADLGVSSHQINTPERGFSTRFCGKLDMRMSKTTSKTALDIINNYKKSELFRIFEEYGELTNAEQVVEIICSIRKNMEIKTTDDLKKFLLDNIKVPFFYRIKFLSKIFQALRIEVNDELNNLKEILTNSMNILKKDGRLVIISYHSLEDRIVKSFFKNGCFENDKNKNIFIKSLTKKPISPTKEEVLQNNRSRSAKLRVGIKL